MFEYHNNILCVHASWLYEVEQIISKDSYDKLKQRGFLKIVRRGGNGRKALVEFETMKTWIKDAIVKKFGHPVDILKPHSVVNFIQLDHKAAEFYSTYRLQDGRYLPEDTQKEYRVNAEILNAANAKYIETYSFIRSSGGSAPKLWDRIASEVSYLDKEKYPHTLPSNTRRFRERLNKYKKQGYTALIHKSYGNDNSRKVTAQIERLMLSLYCQPSKPYAQDVHAFYLQFLGGAIDVADVKTGELFKPEDFYNDAGDPVIVSEATVWNYLRDPKNQVIVDKYREGTMAFQAEHRPHHHRKKPNYSLSKISMDDRDLPRKMHDGRRVKAYYSYDVTSGCVIGASYSKKKDKQLFINCMRDMFRFLKKNDFGMPMEVEVEHHLVNSYKNDLMKAGVVFPFVRWAVAGNAQEKHAENFNKAKKYGYEKKYQEGIGRFYNKLKANRVHSDKVFDEHNDTYKQKTYDFEQLVADDMNIVEKYNNDLHPNQKKYKGMTRMDVLKYHVNPNLVKHDDAVLAKYIGERIKTTIVRSQYVRALYARYQIASPDTLSQLQPNNYSVDAYYIPETHVNTVYLFQNNDFVCEAQKIVEYNTARAERDLNDDAALEAQRKYVKAFDNMVKSDSKDVAKVAIIQKTDFDAYEQEAEEYVNDTPEEDEFENLLKHDTSAEDEQDAIDSL